MHICTMLSQRYVTTLENNGCFMYAMINQLLLITFSKFFIVLENS